LKNQYLEVYRAAIPFKNKTTEHTESAETAKKRKIFRIHATLRGLGALGVLGGEIFGFLMGTPGIRGWS
jgi:hypothetical protein